MSRVKRFTLALISGYALLAANTVYTLVSVPLALHYLSKEEFGLWALVMQMANFNLILIDLGMSGSLSRILIDHKDDRQTPVYGSVIQTGVLVLVVQAVLIGTVGALISVWLPVWMHVPEKFWAIFRTLMIWQCAVLGAAFVTRIFAFILTAHQRYDLCNYANIASFFVNLGAVWISFHYGLGLYSMLTGFVTGTALVSVYSAWAVVRYGLLPARGCWGRPSFSTFRQLFVFGTDVFIMNIGNQLIIASQVPVVTRTLGLEAATVWSVAVKVFVLAQQMINRIFDFSFGALAEMIVRNERDRLKMRFRDVMVLTGSLASAVGVSLALCNQNFLSIWTHGRVTWNPFNDTLMAFSLFVYSCTRLSVGLTGLTKNIGRMRYIYFVEGLAFVCLALWVAPFLGLGGIIGAGILTDLLCSGVFGPRRAVKLFDTPFLLLIREWLFRPISMFLAAALIATPLWYLTKSFNTEVQFAVRVSVFAPTIAVLFWRIGMPRHIRTELLVRARNSAARRFLSRIV